jgi:hypothetical protein
MMVFVLLRRCSQFVFGTHVEVARPRIESDADYRAPAFWYLYGR